jgi:putative ABC transport system substrate-binding protein
MRRREFITLLGAAAWPFAASAQPAAPMRRIGVLIGLPQSDLEGQRWVRKFIQAMRDAGWRNGTNIQIDLRYARDLEQMRMIAKQFAELQLDVIHVTTGLATAEVVRHTTTIPVVFSMVNDPVISGFVQSLERPGRNATGFTNIDSGLPGKWLELLKEIEPRVRHVALLHNPLTAQLQQRWLQFELPAASLGIMVQAAPVRETAEIEKTIAALGQNPHVGLVMIPDSFFNLPRTQLIISLAARHRVLAVYPFRDFVNAGGLASYAVDFPDLQARAAGYVDRILKGATPAELPVQAPTKFELVINLKTAKALDLRLSPKLLARADEVME